jgi:hypothetical protein
MNDMIVAGSYTGELDALLAKGALEGAGIDCRARINGDATELLVAPKDAEKAKEILGGSSALPF